MEGPPRHEREEVCRRLRSILSACRNSVIEHLKDKNIERLRWRIEKTLIELKHLEELTEEGLTTAAKFIRNSAA